MAFEEHILIDVFIASCLQDKMFLSIIDNWPIKLEVIHTICIKQFMDLGIFYVEPFSMADEIRSQLGIILKTSPLLKEMIDRAKKQAAQAAHRNKNKSS